MEIAAGVDAIAWRNTQVFPSMDGSRTQWRRGGGHSACQSPHQNEHGFPLPSLHHTIPHFSSSFPETHANLICNVCEDEEAQKSCLNHPVTAVSLHTTAPYHQEMLLKLKTS